MQKNPQFSFQSKPQLSLNPRSPYIELGGASDKNYHIKSADSHLILSSSAGSIVALSSSLYASGSSHSITGTLRVDPNLDLSNADSVYHIRAVNSHLVLSSSAGSVMELSSSQDFSNTDKNYHIRAVNGNLILSSSVNSVIAFSASQNFVNADKPYHVRTINSDLVLSSSATSKVTVSGNIHVSNTNPWIHFVNSDTATPQQTRHIMIVSFRNHLEFQNRDDRAISALSAPIWLDMTTGSIVLNQTGSHHIQALRDRLILSSALYPQTRSLP